MAERRPRIERAYIARYERVDGETSKYRRVPVTAVAIRCCCGSVTSGHEFGFMTCDVCGLWIQYRTTLREDRRTVDGEIVDVLYPPYQKTLTFVFKSQSDAGRFAHQLRPRVIEGIPEPCGRHWLVSVTWRANLMSDWARIVELAGQCGGMFPVQGGWYGAGQSERCAQPPTDHRNNGHPEPSGPRAEEREQLERIGRMIAKHYGIPISHVRHIGILYHTGDQWSAKRFWQHWNGKHWLDEPR